MTVLEWLKDSTGFSNFSEGNFVKIALDRECNPMDDVYGTNVTKRQRELMTADIIFTRVFLMPSSTPSLSQSHNGYQKTIGQEQDLNLKEKIKYAIQIYRVYGDEKAELLENATKRKIRIVPIQDVDRL